MFAKCLSFSRLALVRKMDEIKKDVSMDLDILNCLDITRSKKRLFVIETEGKVRDIGLQVSIFLHKTQKSSSFLR